MGGAQDLEVDIVAERVLQVVDQADFFKINRAGVCDNDFDIDQMSRVVAINTVGDLIAEDLVELFSDANPWRIDDAWASSSKA